MHLLSWTGSRGARPSEVLSINAASHGEPHHPDGVAINHQVNLGSVQGGDSGAQGEDAALVQHGQRSNIEAQLTNSGQVWSERCQRQADAIEHPKIERDDVEAGPSRLDRPSTEQQPKCGPYEEERQHVARGGGVCVSVQSTHSLPTESKERSRARSAFVPYLRDRELR